MSQDSRAFRDALGSYATGVAIITADAGEGRAHAITVNSFASVSLEPRLVLWSLGDQSDTYPVFSKAERWGVSVAHADAEETARCYAGKGRAQATAEELEELGGAPVFKHALAAFGCVTFQRRTLGDHLLIVGRVEDFKVSDGPALGFFRGRFIKTTGD